ncbi:MAG: HAMP domain-containing sensor histidine kinase [Candidatus Omnitrophica bacterium]|nr:HAMP domain-containing sensor histidine kinase [Candidatus Omnitrophota bacterium]
MFFKSIRFKVLLWYILFLTLTLSIFSFILYKGFHKELFDGLDDLLSVRAEGVVDSVIAYWDIPYQGKLATSDIDEVRLADFVATARGWVEEKRRDPELMSLFVRITDIKGVVIIASKSMPHIVQLESDDFKDVAGGIESFDTVSGESIKGEQIKFRIYSKPITIGSEVRYIVQVAGPASLVSIALGKLRIMLFILIPLTIILAAIPGVILVSLTLHPVDNMVRTLRQITAENLKLRLHIPDTKDEIKRLADTFNDMIDRLDRSFSSHNRFIQNISQELKVPMNDLQEDLEGAVDKELSKEEQGLLIKRASKSLNVFSKTIDNLLILSQIDDSMTPFEIRKVNLNRLIDHVIKQIRSQASEKDIELFFSSLEEVIIDGDDKQLKQLVTNLIDNAIKYTYRNGKVSVSVEKANGHARISVGDTGIGISKDEIPYIFDRFYQVKKSRSSSQSFGLGLSSVRLIVEEHKGSVSVDSEEGKGSTFTVFLPISYQG